MAVSLPRMGVDEFLERLQGALPFDIAPDVGERLWAHYEELSRWSPRLSLIGSGTAAEIVKRHYAESLLALPLLDEAECLVDLGSGAGFPGFVLAAARPEMEVTLVESRQRKAVFLRSAARRASLSCRVVNARVGSSLPVEMPTAVDVITVRAVRFEAEQWSVIAERLGQGGRILRWIGPAAAPMSGRFSVRRRVAIGESRRVIEELVETRTVRGHP